MNPPAKIPTTKKFNILWSIGYWDGPLSGVVEYKGKVCYFAVIKYTYGDRGHRTQGIFEITGEESAQLQKQHDDFCAMVGTHTNYKNNRRDPAGLVHKKDFAPFYEKYPVQDYYDKKDIGSKIVDSRTPIAKFK